MSKKVIACVSAFMVMVGALPAALHAGWIDDGIPVIVDGVNQKSVQMCADENGGAFVTWYNYQGQVYVQRIDADGNIQWNPSGVRVCTVSSSQVNPRIVVDTDGYAIIVWEDYRNGYKDIFAQKVNANGDLLWNTQGVPVCTADLPQENIDIVSVGWDGVVIAWEDHRDQNNHIYAQRLNLAGGRAWGQNGIAVSNLRYSIKPRLVAGESWTGRTIIVYEKVDFSSGHTYIFAKHIEKNGTFLGAWSEEIVVFGGDANNGNPEITHDGIGGAIVACEYYEATRTRIRKQRLDTDNSGQLYPFWALYPNDFIENTQYSQFAPRITTDGGGNAIIVHEENRAGVDNIYARKLSSAYGGHVWNPPVTPVCVFENYQRGDVRIVLARNNGIIITWSDKRGDGANSNVYAQMLKNDGTTLWAANGFQLSGLEAKQEVPVIATDGNGGAITAWLDNRNSTYSRDIYAERVIPEIACDISWAAYHTTTGEPTGFDTLGGCPQGDMQALKTALDFNADVMLGNVDAAELTLDKPDDGVSFWSLGDIHADSDAVAPLYETSITHSEIGGCNICDECGLLDISIRLNGVRIGSVADFSANSPDANNDGVVGLVDFSNFAMTYQKPDNYDPCFDYNYDGFVNLVDFATFGLHYQHLAPAGAMPRVVPHDEGSPVAGVGLATRLTEGGDLAVSVSYENRENAATMMLAIATGNPTTEFSEWIPAPELAEHTIATSIHKHGQEVITVAVFDLEPPLEPGAALGVLLFTVSTEGPSPDPTDIHLLKGEVLDVTGEVHNLGGIALAPASAPLPARTSLLGHYPNPFNPKTTIEFSLVRGTHIKLSVYDTRGRMVRELVNEFRPADLHRVEWNGTDDSGQRVSSGNYFYIFEADGIRESRKMVLLK